MSSISKIWNKLRNPEYRSSFVASQINVGVPFQIHALMKSRGWTQSQLAERAGMLQPRISAMLKPGKTRFNIETLRRLAEAFDCALIVRFAPFSELVKWSDSFNPEQFDIPKFGYDAGLVERMPVASESKQAFANATTAREAYGTSASDLVRDLPNMAPRGMEGDQLSDQSRFANQRGGLIKFPGLLVSYSNQVTGAARSR